MPGYTEYVLAEGSFSYGQAVAVITAYRNVFIQDDPGMHFRRVIRNAEGQRRWRCRNSEPGVAFTSTRAAREWLILNMAGLEREEFRVLYLNNQNQLIAGETLFTGTINRTEVHPREVIKRALYHNAAAVVLAHNHPSGEVTPSKADRLITERLVQALGLVDLRVPDHLIVGGNQVFSFAEHGLL
ncbi:DNA repair protein [Escherichia coli]|nr:DNA repair protein [Escherichia coli]